MGEPVKIYDLAESLIRLSGLEPNVDIPIQITGLRPGEKLYEEILMSEEGLSDTKHDKIFITKPENFSAKKMETTIKELKQFLKNENHTKADIKKEMKKIVPTFKEPEEINNKLLKAKQEEKHLEPKIKIETALAKKVIQLEDLKQVVNN